MASKCKSFMLKQHFQGKPKEDDFKMLEEPVPTSLADGGELDIGALHLEFRHHIAVGKSKS